MPDIPHPTSGSRTLRPPTPEQVEIYDVCEEDGDLFHDSDAIHVQCQLHGTELWVHDISVRTEARRTGIARSVLKAIRDEHPGLGIVANGVDWPSDSGLFWKAMVEEGVVDRLITYEHGEIAADDLAQARTPGSS